MCIIAYGLALAIVIALLLVMAWFEKNTPHR
jgi:hypothetical protein